MPKHLSTATPNFSDPWETALNKHHAETSAIPRSPS